MRLLFLGLAVASSVLAQCPQNFTADDQGNCYGPWIDAVDHSSAYDRCAFLNSFMFDISNAFVNSAVRQQAEGKEKVWLGLTCLNSNVSTCKWDDGRQLSETSFTNFASGSPNPSAGACIYMDVATGRWYNTDCVSSTASARCQNVPALSVKMPFCTDGSLYFRGNCYLGKLVYSTQQALDSCRQGCGDLASIHSVAETSIVSDVASFGVTTKYGYIGLSENGKSMNWSDGTSYDYKNWGYQNDGIGLCTSIAGVNDVIKKGAWISAQCSLPSPQNAICKKNVVNSCDPSPGSATCDGPALLVNSGQFKSPGFPAASGQTSCEYILMINASSKDDKRYGVTVALNFMDLSLDKTSFIRIYNSLYDNTPFAVLTNTNFSATTILSNANTMKVMFETTGYGNNYFRAFFGDGRPHCFDTEVLYGSGQNISTPNYPDYPPGVNEICEYRFVSSLQAVNVFFQTLELYQGYIYDGNGNLLLHDSQTKYNLTVGSLTPVLRVSVDANYRASKFLASFDSHK